GGERAMQFLLILILGAAAGFIVTRLMGRELPIIHTVAIGVIGVLVGWALLTLLLGLVGVAFVVVAAFLGAFLVLWAWEALVERR
ncbi:MAG: GlsB/YeaQ/YmgE family stress response membrane protein, partial [Alphaproteobacteria bacterium]